MSEARSIDETFAEAIRCHQTGRLADAERLYRAVVASCPSHAESVNGLGQIALQKGQHAAAAALFEKAIGIDPRAAHVHRNLGDALKDLDRLEPAIAAYGRAIALKPDDAQAYGNLGTLYVSQGRRDAACRAFEAAIELSPRCGSYYRLRAFAEALAPAHPLIGRMEVLAQSMSTLPEADQMHLHFALGTAYGDGGDYRRSFDHLLAGNDLKRKRVAYDEQKALASLDRIQRVFSREFLAARAEFGLASRLPIFIVGMPRSGSTLVEQILASHPDVFGVGELQILLQLLRGLSATAKADFPEMILPLTDIQINRLAEQYLALLRAEAPKMPRIVDKVLENFMGVGLISIMLPRAKIIHIHRDPVDTCLSSFAKLFNGNHLAYTYDLAELGRFYRAYERLMDHWREVVPAGVMLDVRYEDLVREFEPQARRILAHCGLAWDERCLAFYKTERVVKTASALQVRQPLDDTGLEKWRAYREYARPLIDALDRLAAT